MAFDSIEYLQAYKDRGEFPAIHDALTNLVLAYKLPKIQGLDLCCSTGLMAQRLDTSPHISMRGVEMDNDAIALGREHGVTVPITSMVINGSTLEQFRDWLYVNRIELVVARRCFPELLPMENDPFGPKLFAAMKKAGVKHIFVQGRVLSPKSVHPLKSITEEVALLSQHFNLIEQEKDCAVFSTDSRLQRLQLIASNVMPTKQWGF